MEDEFEEEVPEEIPTEEIVEEVDYLGTAEDLEFYLG